MILRGTARRRPGLAVIHGIWYSIRTTREPEKLIKK